MSGLRGYIQPPPHDEVPRDHFSIMDLATEETTKTQSITETMSDLGGHSSAPCSCSTQVQSNITPPVREVCEHQDPARGLGEHQDHEVDTQPVVTTLPVRGEDDEVTKTQTIIYDEVTKTQSVATLSVRGMGDHQDVEITDTQSIATPPVRGVGEHLDPVRGNG